MNSHYLQKLEFNKILENLSNYCSTYIGKKLALDLSPCNNPNTVNKLLAETRRGRKFNLCKFYSDFL